MTTPSSYERRVLDIIRECDVGIEQLSVCAREAPSPRRQLCKQAITGMIIEREGLKRGLVGPEEAAAACSLGSAGTGEEKAYTPEGELADT